MKLLLPLCVGLFVLPAFGQGSRYDSYNVTSSTNTQTGSQSTLYTLPFSKVTVCAYPDDGGTPCANTVPLYSDAALTQPLANPIVADVHGRWGFWARPGNYSYSVVTANGTYSGTSALTLGSPTVTSGGGGGGGTPTLPIAVGTPGALSVPWGYSPSWRIGGRMAYSYGSQSTLPIQSAMHFQTKMNYSVDLAPDFPGAYGASVPAGINSEVETSGGSNIQAHAIDGYVVNGGSQDAVGVSGRVVRKAGATSATSGLADAAGVYGSAYQQSTTNGAVMGGEMSIFQNVPGTTPLDYLKNYAPGWAVALHINSLSTGSRADAGVAVEGAPGMNGFWNGLILDNSLFNGASGAPANGVTGTVGINGGDWDVAKFPETGIKMGNAKQHLWCNYGQCTVNAANGILGLYGGSITAPTTGAGLRLYASNTAPGFIDFFNGGTLGANIFFNHDSNTLTIQGQPNNTYINPNGGTVYIGSSTDPGYISTDRFHETLHTPASSAETCAPGDFTADAGFVYVCTDVNSWKRAALSTF